ncbi:MAG: hypothetical protein WB699_14605 [Bacteroidota bacterium]
MRKIRMFSSILIALAFAVLPHEAHAQSLDWVFSHIKEKILIDGAYTTLWSTDTLQRMGTKIAPNGVLKRADGSDFTFQKAHANPQGTVSHDYSYTMIYLAEKYRSYLRPLLIRQTEEVSQVVRSRYGNNDSTLSNEVYVSYYSPEDFHALNQSDPDTYAKIVRLITAKPGFPLWQHEIHHDSNLKVATTNDDYRWYAEVNSGYPFGPPPREQISLDISPYQVNFSDAIFSEKESIGVRGFGFEAGFGNRVLNMLAYQSPILSWGGRLLMFFQGDWSNLDSAGFLDLRILGRSKVNTEKFIVHSKLSSADPVFALDPPKMNVQPGFALELGIGTRFFDGRLPFVTLYYGGGSKDYSNPMITYDGATGKKAYFTTTQLEGYLSYFWKMDRRGYNRFKLDLGVGSHDVWDVSYDSLNHVEEGIQLLGTNNLQVLLALDYSHNSSEEPTQYLPLTEFGARMRFFFNRLTVNPWIKIFKSGSHELRLEFCAVTPPIGRSLFSWEAEKGSMMILRYRYGL